METMPDSSDHGARLPYQPAVKGVPLRSLQNRWPQRPAAQHLRRNRQTLLNTPSPCHRPGPTREQGDIWSRWSAAAAGTKLNYNET